MNAIRWKLVGVGGVVCLLLLAATAWAQPFGPGRGPGFGRGGGRGPDASFAADRATFHYLLTHRGEIRRSVTERDDGVETLTESDSPEVAERIREHVRAMYARVKEGRGIHLRDPLFRALFGAAAKIEMELEPTAKGMRVVETSADPHVAGLIREHARVVSLFLANGFEEVHKDHQPPAAPPPRR